MITESVVSQTRIVLWFLCLIVLGTILGVSGTVLVRMAPWEKEGNSVRGESQAVSAATLLGNGKNLDELRHWIGETSSDEAPGDLGLGREKLGRFHRWRDLAETNPEAAVELLKNWTPWNERFDAARVAFRAIAESDPNRALELARTIPKSELQAVALEPVLEMLAEQGQVEPVGLLECFWKGSMIVDREWIQRVTARCAERWSDSNLQAVLNDLSTRHESFRRAAGEPVLQAWLRRNPTAALAWVAQHQQQHSVLTDFSQHILDSDVLADSKAQLEWVRNELSGEARTEALARVLRRLAASDLDRAWRVMETDLDPDEWHRVIDVLGTRYAAEYPEEALTWLDSLPGASDRQLVRRQAIVALAAHDTDRAKQLFLQEQVTDRDRFNHSNFPMELGAALMRADPDGTLTWLNSITDPIRRGRLTEGVVEVWGETEPLRAMELTAKWPRTRWAEESLLNLAGSQIESDPEPVLRILEQLPHHVRTSVAESLNRIHDPNLSPETQNSLSQWIGDD